MRTPIDFYFDFSSPYGYFASTRIDELAERHARKVAWHPILLGAVFKVSGAAPLTQVPLKGEYALHDFARSARYHGIPFSQPAQLPISSVAAARATLWVEGTLGSDLSVRFCKAVYRAYFVDGMDVTQRETLARIAAGLDIDGEAMLAGSQDPAVKERLRAEVEAAVARGVFGSPFVIADGEPFWGFDRFEQLEAFLKNGTI